MKRIYLSPPHMGGEEIKLVQEVFSSNWIAPAGPDIDRFEHELCVYNQIDYCAALSSGTSAIHLALVVLGIEPGDEVICSSFTFAGSCNPISYLKAVPVFIDSEPETWNMDPELLELGIKDGIKKGKKPKAIILVHLYGMPARLDHILEVAERYEIPVIEDAAEGLGSSYKRQKLGTLGDIGIYSFNGNKIITTSGGGALVSRNGEWVARAKFLSQQARDAAPHYQHSQIGYNYRMSNICAAIGRGQLKVLDERVLARRRNFESYRKHLSQYESVSFQKEPHDSYSNRWLTCIIFRDDVPFEVEELRLAMEDVNIESRPLWKPMHLQPVFRQALFYGSGVCHNLFKRGLCLPSGSSLSESEISRVTEVIHKFLAR